MATKEKEINALKTAESFKGLEVTDQYGKRAVIEEIVGTAALTNCGGTPVVYHTSKLFHEGKSVFEHLNSNENGQ